MVKTGALVDWADRLGGKVGKENPNPGFSGKAARRAPQAGTPLSPSKDNEWAMAGNDEGEDDDKFYNQVRRMPGL
jgi:hypothetical protein